MSMSDYEFLIEKVRTELSEAKAAIKAKRPDIAKACLLHACKLLETLKGR